MLRAKIHRATVTQADLHYEGSITLPPALLAAADILPHEAVDVWNVTNGARFETYAIQGVAGATDICVNGAAAHRVTPGDIVIIACFALLTDAEARGHQPRIVFVDGSNQIVRQGGEIPGPQRRG
jgi:aspartate 1-decarboxylase